MKRAEIIYKNIKIFIPKQPFYYKKIHNLIKEIFHEK